MTTYEKVTISDIAREASVSPSTVSRVLRGTTAVSEDKYQAVMSAVKALDYRPNIFAQSLASGQSMTLGVLTQRFGSPFYDGILQGILHGLENTGYSPLFADGRWDSSVEVQALQTLVDRKIDGLIVLGGQIPVRRLQALAEQMAVVIVAREIPSLSHLCLSVSNYESAYQAVRYLIDQGHRHIAHISAPPPDSEINDIVQRYHGYLQALRDAGITPDPQLVVEGDLQQYSGVLAAERLLARGRPFSAIFSANDQMAFGARLTLHRKGIHVPKEVSIIGFDDEPSAAYMIPPLTTVRQPSLELGREAAAAVLKLIAGDINISHQFPAELIVRESVTPVK